MFMAAAALHGEFRLEGVDVECLAFGGAEDALA